MSENVTSVSNVKKSEAIIVNWITDVHFQSSLSSLK